MVEECPGMGRSSVLLNLLSKYKDFLSKYRQELPERFIFQ